MSLQTGVECEEGDVRLAGGVTNSSGRLEVCANGMWGRVCNALQYWGPDNARVVCRQLGFSGEGNRNSSNTILQKCYYNTKCVGAMNFI